MAKPLSPPSPHNPSRKRPTQLTDPGCLPLTRWGLNRISGIGNLSREDREEIEQEITLHLWRQLPQWDSHRGSLTTFVARIVSHKFFDLCRARNAACRRPSRPVLSIDRSVNHDDNSKGICLSSIVPAQDQRESTDLSLDVRTTVSNLPDDLAQICRVLQKHSVSEAARLLKIPRSTLYGQMELIRQRFTDDGLQTYL